MEELKNENELEKENAQAESDEQDFDAESFRVKLNQFEGPLDLLLTLIKSAKIDICDIFLS